MKRFTSCYWRCRSGRVRGWALLVVGGILLLAAGLAWCHRGRVEQGGRAGTRSGRGEAGLSEEERGPGDGPGARAARKPLPPKPPKPQLESFRQFLDEIDREDLQRAKLVDRHEDEDGAKMFVFEITPTGEEWMDYTARWKERTPPVESADAKDLMQARVLSGFIPVKLKRFVTIREGGGVVNFVATDVGSDAVWSRRKLPTDSNEMERGQVTAQEGEPRRWNYRYLMKLAEGK